MFGSREGQNSISVRRQLRRSCRPRWLHASRRLGSRELENVRRARSKRGWREKRRLRRGLKKKRRPEKKRNGDNVCSKRSKRERKKGGM